MSRGFPYDISKHKSLLNTQRFVSYPTVNTAPLHYKDQAVNIV